MATGIATIHVRRRRKKVSVIGMGRSPRGQKFVRQIIELQVESLDDPKFKEQMQAAVEQMLPQVASDIL